MSLKQKSQMSQFLVILSNALVDGVFHMLEYPTMIAVEPVSSYDANYTSL